MHLYIVHTRSRYILLTYNIIKKEKIDVVNFFHGKNEGVVDVIVM